MMRKSKKLFIIGLIILVASVLLKNALHLKFHISHSGELSKGVYQYQTNSIAVGDWVEACMPQHISPYARLLGYIQAGNCPDGSKPLYLQVVAMQGDQVEITPLIVKINGVVQKNIIRLERDANNIEIPSIDEGQYITKTDEVWLMGNRPKTWDSRYFGPIHKKHILHVVKPIMVWDETNGETTSETTGETTNESQK